MNKKRVYVITSFALIVFSFAITALGQMGRPFPPGGGGGGTPTPTPTPEPPNTVVTNVSSSGNLDYTNGNKIASDLNGNLHVVYTVEGLVKYTSSSDGGATWTFSATLGSGAMPVVAADDTGNVGVAHQLNGQIYYLYKTPFGGWSSPLQLTSTYTGSEPSMVGVGSKMYLVWAGFEVYYTSFATTAPVAPATPESVSGLMCPNVTYRLPSIATSRSTGADPVVTVAFYADNTQCTLGTVGVHVYERPTGGAPVWPNVTNPIMGESQTGYFPAISSLSLASERGTGTYYLIYCYRPDARYLWKTRFLRSDSPGAIWRAVNYFGSDISTPVIADVAAITGAGQFKVAYSNAAGGTALQTGIWQNATPSYISNIPKSYHGRSPHVIDFTLHNSMTGETKGVNLIFEFNDTVTAQIRTDHFNWFYIP